MNKSYQQKNTLIKIMRSLQMLLNWMRTQEKEKQGILLRSQAVQRSLPHLNDVNTTILRGAVHTQDSGQVSGTNTSRRADQEGDATHVTF
ncbi:uncharacterized protein [Dysidea avara]|uniref:uncharacterized protein isoform X2 n=1 Tax=Dysidea avara TaxID=196820 RepID=UPI0033307E23